MHLRLHLLLALAATGSLAQPMPVAAQAVVLGAKSDWQLDYAEDSCAIRRSFGDESGTTWLELRSYSPLDPVLEITVSSDRFAVRRSEPVSHFVPAGQPFLYDLQSYRELEGLPGVQFYNQVWPDNPSWDIVADRDPELIAESQSAATVADFRRGVTGFAVSNAFEEDFIVATGAMFRPMGALHACLNDLVQSWGIDPAAPAGSAYQVRSATWLDPQPGGWESALTERRPQGFRLSGALRQINFRVIVGADGRAEVCRVTRPQVDAAYQDWACGVILSRAAFDPARDGSDQPVRSLYRAAVVHSDMIPRAR